MRRELIEKAKGVLAEGRKNHPRSSGTQEPGRTSNGGLSIPRLKLRLGLEFY
jgi:hypothetical protein